MRLVYFIVIGVVSSGIAFGSARAEESAASRALTLRLTQIEGSAEAARPRIAPPPRHGIEILSDRTVRAGVQRRQPRRLSNDHLVIAGLTRSGVEVWRQTLIDPRLIRAELPDKNGRLSSATYFRSEATFSIALPIGREIGQLKIMKPRWTGTTFAFDEIGSLDLDR